MTSLSSLCRRTRCIVKDKYPDQLRRSAFPRWPVVAKTYGIGFPSLPEALAFEEGFSEDPSCCKLDGGTADARLQAQRVAKFSPTSIECCKRCLGGRRLSPTAMRRARMRPRSPTIEGESHGASW